MVRITSVMGGGKTVRAVIQPCRLGHISSHTFLPFPGFVPNAPGWGDVKTPRNLQAANMMGASYLTSPEEI